MKRILDSISVILTCILLVGFFSMPVFAAEARATSVVPSLSFTGTTANCSVSVSAIGKNISMTMQLCQGTVVLKTWTGSGTSYLCLSEEYSVERGNTYTLKVSGTVGGEAVSSAPITAKCK